MKKLIVANWKMNPQTFAEARKHFLALKKVASTLSGVQTVISSPVVFLSRLSALYKGHRIQFAAQDIAPEESGAHTGSTSVGMVKDAGATYTIIGHSERRALGETNEQVAQKILLALKHKLNVILCIGESARSHHNGTHLTFLTEQLTVALKDLTQKELKSVVIAYEPIWAIGKSVDDAMNPHELHETVLFIRKIIADLHSKSSALNIPIIYGGSVEAGNAQKLLVDGMADGFLVGHASLDPKAFNEILRIANKC